MCNIHLGQYEGTYCLICIILVLNHYTFPSKCFSSPLFCVVDAVEDPAEAEDMVLFPQRICSLFIEPNDTYDNIKEEIRDVHYLECAKMKMGWSGLRQSHGGGPQQARRVGMD